MKIACAQLDLAWLDRNANYDKARDMAIRAGEAGAELLLLPEMFPTGFSLDTSATAEPPDGPTPRFFRELARELDMMVIGGFVLEKAGEKPRNVSLAVDRAGNDLALYEKIHLISLLGEDESYAPGENAVLFDAGDFRASCFICYDLRFPELFRSVVDECGLLMVIASWPTERQMHWDTLIRARAIECQCYVMAVNRVGEGGGYNFTGGSVIIDPYGRVIADAGSEEGLIIADIDSRVVSEARSSMPFLKDRKKRLFAAAAEFEIR